MFGIHSYSSVGREIQMPDTEAQWSWKPDDTGLGRHPPFSGTPYLIEQATVVLAHTRSPAPEPRLSPLALCPDGGQGPPSSIHFTSGIGEREALRPSVSR